MSLYPSNPHPPVLGHNVYIAEFSVNFSYSVDSSLGRVPACNAGGPGLIPGRCSSIFGIWREDRLILCTLYIPVECSEEGLGYSDIYYIPVVSSST